MDISDVWRKGDWAAFFGLFTNNLTNLLTMMGLLLFVVGLPKEFVMGQVVPAFGLAVMCASIFYAWFAYKLKKETGRDDVTALPSGPSAPVYFYRYLPRDYACLSLDARCGVCNSNRISLVFC